jgi:hypothetical protein
VIFISTLSRFIGSGFKQLALHPGYLFYQQKGALLGLESIPFTPVGMHLVPGDIIVATIGTLLKGLVHIDNKYNTDGTERIYK